MFCSRRSAARVWVCVIAESAVGLESRLTGAALNSSQSHFRSVGNGCLPLSPCLLGSICRGCRTKPRVGGVSQASTVRFPDFAKSLLRKTKYEHTLDVAPRPDPYPKAISSALPSRYLLGGQLCRFRLKSCLLLCCLRRRFSLSKLPHRRANFTCANAMQSTSCGSFSACLISN